MYFSCDQFETFDLTCKNAVSRFHFDTEGQNVSNNVKMCNNVKQSCGAMNLWSHSTTAFSTLLAAPLLTSTLINFYHLVFAIKMLKSVEERGLPLSITTPPFQFCILPCLNHDGTSCTKKSDKSWTPFLSRQSVKSPDKIFIQDPTSGSPDYSHREVLINVIAPRIAINSNLQGSELSFVQRFLKGTTLQVGPQKIPTQLIWNISFMKRLNNLKSVTSLVCHLVYM